MAPTELNCAIEASALEECVIPENDLSPRSDPYFYIKLNLRLSTYLRSELISTCQYEHATFDPSMIHAFICSWYPEIHNYPATWRFLIGWITDCMDCLSTDPRNMGAAILPMEVSISLDEIKEVTIEEGDTTEPMCVICHDNLYPDYIVVRTPCNHLFHLSCIDEWVKRSETCPMCRFDLPMSDYVPL